MRAPKPRRDAPKEYNEATCLTCEGKPAFPWASLPAHLRDVHKHEGTKGKRQGQLFLDGAGGRYSQTWEWIIGDVQVRQTVGRW